MNPLVEFRLPKDTACLVVLRSTLNDLLSNTGNKKVSKIEFREDQIDIGGRVKYILIELKTDEDLKAMQRSFHRRLTKGPIGFDATISRCVDIIKMLKRLESSGSVYVFMFSYC